MSQKASLTFFALVLMAGLVYLAFNPEVANQVIYWVKSQFTTGEMPKVNSTGYVPIVPK